MKITCAFVAALMPAAAAFAFDRPTQPTMDPHGARAVSAHVATHAEAKAGLGEGRAGGAAWMALGPYGGDVQDVALSPTTTGLMLAGIAPAGSSGGALFRSTDSGANWNVVSQLSTISVYDIEFALDGTIYVATIDSVWKSTNGGTSFTALNLNIGLNDQVFDLTIHPVDPNNLWIGIADALGGQAVNVMQSTDGGATWVNRTPPLASPMSGRAIAINPLNPVEIYAGFGGSFGGSQLWVSTASGAPGTWVNRSAGLPNTPINDLVHDGARALVCGGQLFGGQNFGLYETLNQGQTWTALHTASWPSLVVNDIALDPANPNTRFVVTANTGVYRSVNGGAWEFGVGGSNAYALNAIRFGANSSHLLLGANSTGVLQSTNGGASFTITSNGIGKLDVFSIASNPNDINELAIAFQGLNNGGVYRSIDGGQTWTLQSLPGTRYSHVQFSPTGTLYAISSGPSSIAPEGVYRRNPNGTWTGLGPDQGNLFESDLAFMCFGAADPDLLFFAVGADFGVAGSEATIWRTTAGGGPGNWTKVYEGPATSEFVTDIRFVGTTNTLIASFVDFGSPQTGGVLRSTSGGGLGTWSPSMTGLPANVQAKALSPSPASPQTFLLGDRQFGTAGGMYRTTDGGETWSSTGFAGQVWDVVADPLDDQIVYMLQLNPTAVWKSTNGGASFAPFNNGLSFSGSVRDLAYGPGVSRGAAAPRLLLATTAGSFATDLPIPCAAADINCDGVVNVSDLLAVINQWGPCPAPPASCPADIAPPPSGDGVVNVSDLLMVINNWG